MKKPGAALLLAVLVVSCRGEGEPTRDSGPLAAFGTIERLDPRLDAILPARYTGEPHDDEPGSNGLLGG
jgi:hypothetical protein